MKKLLLTMCVVLCACGIKAEVNPDVWHRPDSLVILQQEDSISWSDEYTIFAVVRSLSDSTEECLWSFSENDTISAAVLTKGVYTSSAGKLISHNPHDFSKWCVYAYHSGINADSTKQRSFRLGEQLVYVDSLTTDILPARVEIEEIAYFNRNVSRLVSNAFQTYLALKYGVTLDIAPYISQSGDTLWHPEHDEDFYHRVIGVGNDTVCNWTSCVSRSKEDSLLYIQTDSLMPNEYIVVGDEDGPLVWHRDIDDEYSLQRVWRIRQFVNQPKHITLAVRLFLMEETADSLQLVITDANGLELQTIVPDSIIMDSLCYFSLNRIDSLMHIHIKGVLQDKIHSMCDDYHSQTEGSSNTDILFDVNSQTIVINGYSDEQIFELYLYDNLGRYFARITSRNPIDVKTLPNMVSYIEIIANNQIVGVINIPVTMH